MRGWVEEVRGSVEALLFVVDVVEFAARSRPPVFCCCSRCNLQVENDLSISSMLRYGIGHEWPRMATHGRSICLVRGDVCTAYRVVTPVVNASTMHCD